MRTRQRILWQRLPRADLLATSVLTLLIAVKAWERFYFPEWLSRTDIVNQYLPWWSYLGEQLRAGNIPGWNPHQFGGTPFLGDPQSGWMYLPVMVPFVLLPPLAALKTYVVVQLLIGGLSTYAFARVLTLRPVASLAAAAAFTFGPFIHHTTYCCNIQSHVAAWIPLALLGIELALRARSWSSRLVGWSVTGLAISQMLAGWIGQGAYNGILVVGTYLAYRILFTSVLPRIPWFRRVRWLAVHGMAILVIGFGLGAVAVLPRLDVNQETNLAGGGYANVEDPEEKSDATVDVMLTRVLAPGFSNRRTTFGAVTLALALIGAVIAGRRAPVPYFAVFSVVVLVLTLDTTPVHRLFYLFPRYQELHEHASTRVLGVLMIGPAILAGAAVDMLPRLSRKWGLVAAVIPLLGIAVMALGLEPRHRSLVAPSQPTMWAIIAVTILVAIGALGRSPTGKWNRLAHIRAWVPVLLVVALLWEPSGRDLVDQLRHSPVGPRTLKVVASNMDENDSNGAGDFLQDLQASSDEPFRYVGYNAAGLRTRGNELGVVYQNRHWSPRYRRLLVGPRSVVLGLYDLQGYNPVQLRRTVDLFLTINDQPLDYHDAYVLPQGMASPWIDLLNVRYIVVPPDVPPGRPDLLHLSQQYRTVFDNGRVRVLENAEALPYAWVVHKARSEEEASALTLVDTGIIDPRTTALLEPGVTVPELGQPVDPSAETVTMERYEADAISLTVRLDTAGMLVLSEIYDPGWKAYVDGEEVELYVVDGVLRGMAVPAGQHEIELRYAPRSISLGMMVSAVTALVMLVGLVGTRRRKVTGAGAPSFVASKVLA